jgi:hypothetical protein
MSLVHVPIESNTLESICFCVLKVFIKKIKFFLFFLFQINFFGVFKSFKCVVVEYNFFFKKNLILIKNNQYHTFKYSYIYEDSEISKVLGYKTFGYVFYSNIHIT